MSGEAATTDELALYRQVRLLKLRALRPVRTHLAGAYASAFRGPGVVFEEHRHYQPGDDVRHIDWRATARFGQPFVKRFVEERELCVLVAMDASASLNFGTGGRSKRGAACEAAAALALSAAADGDRVGGVFFAGDFVRTVKPRRGERHALRVLRQAVSECSAAPFTDVRGPLDLLARLRPHAIVFLISDMLFDPPLWDDGVRRLVAEQARRHDVVAVVVRDRAERDPGRDAILECADAESGRRAPLDLIGRSGRALREAIAARDERIASTLAAAGASIILLDTCADVVLPLQRFFRERGARQRRP